jgi:lipopolysaccharide transport protein LptA
MKRLSRAELAILTFGAAFLALLVAFFRPGHRVASERPQAAANVPPGGEGGQATALLSGFDYTESVGEKRVFRIRADRTVGYGTGVGLPPNRYALEKVALTVYPEEGAPVDVLGERAQYDDRTKAAILSGNVRWTDAQDSALGETDRIEFDPSKRVLHAPGTLHFSRGSFDVRATSGAYDLKTRVLTLAGPIQGASSGAGQAPGGLSSLAADSAEYRRGEGIAELTGKVSASATAGDRLSCDRLLLKFTPEGNRLDWMRAYGSVQGIVAARTSGEAERRYSAEEGILYLDPSGEIRSVHLIGSPASVRETKQQLAARNIDLDFAGGRPVAARASEAVRLASDRGNAQARNASAAFGPSGGFQTLELTGDVRLEGEGRVGLADRVVDVPARGIWLLTGSREKAATVEEGGSKVSADRIEIDRNRRSLRAEGNARAVFVPEKNRPAEAASLLGDPTRPTYGKAERIVLDRETSLASLSGSASLWQESSSVFGDDITLNDAEKSAVAVGKVRAVLSQPVTARGASPASARPTTGAEGPAVITSRRLIYRESQSSAVFEDGVTIVRGTWQATASRGIAHFDKDKKLDRVELVGGVVLDDRATGRHATADTAEDFPKEERTVLHGNPARVSDADGNRVSGSTLTITGRGKNVEVTAPEGGRTETIHKTKPD